MTSTAVKNVISAETDILLAARTIIESEGALDGMSKSWQAEKLAFAHGIMAAYHAQDAVTLRKMGL